MCRICFFCPDESGDKEYGWVQMDMLHQIGDKKTRECSSCKAFVHQKCILYIWQII